MAKAITVEQARELAERRSAGEFNDDPDMLRTVNHLIVQTAKRQQPGQDNAVLTDDEPTLFDDIKRRTFGALNVAGTVATSALSEVPVGLYGLARAPFIGLDESATEMRELQDALTFDPRTHTAEQMLRSIAAPFVYLDKGADFVASKAGRGNPLAQTIIYTSLMGLTDIAGIKGGRAVSGTSRRLKNIRKANRQVRDAADELGIRLSPSEVSGDIVRKAADMVPEVRAAHAGELRAALQQAEELQAATVKQFTDRARSSKAFVDVKQAKEFAANAQRNLLQDGFDLAEMKTVQKRLKDIAELDRRSPTELTRPKDAPKGRQIAKTDKVTVTANAPSSAVRKSGAHINDVEIIRRRIEKTIQERRPRRNLPETNNETLALKNLENQLTEWLDQQFNTDMISGDQRAVRRWKDANDARRRYVDRFVNDKVISQLIDREATPGQIHRWLVGTSAMGLKPQASSVIRRIKTILGDRHPSVEGIRQDFLYEIAAPLVQEKPNFDAFVRNVDNTFKNHAELVNELKLNKSGIRELRNFAAAASKRGVAPQNINFDVARSMAQMLFGHDIARRGLIVRTMTMPFRLSWDAVKIMTGSDKRAFIKELANATHGQPAIPKGSAAAGRAIAGAFWADLPGAIREEDQDDL